MSLFVLSCTSRHGDNKRSRGIILERDTSITQFSDGTYLTDIRSIFFDAHNYYISDYSQSQVRVLNRDLELTHTLGREGKGPGEFGGSGHLFVDGDTLFVQNDGRQSLELFVDNNYDTTVGFQPVGRYNSNSRFFVRDGKIIISISDGSHSLCLYNYKANSVFRFGKVHTYGTRRETTVKNQRHVVAYRDHIIAVSVNRPEIETYDFEGELLERFTFSDISAVDRMLEYIKKQPKDRDSYFNLVSDVSVYGDKLYLLLLTVDQTEDRNLNTVAEIELTGEGLGKRRVLGLGEGWFKTISATEEYLLAFDGKQGRLNRYRIK